MKREKINKSEIMGPHKLKTLEIDIENKIFRINGEDFGKKCKSVSIVCTPPEWRYSVIVDKPIEFVATYDLKGAKKNRAVYEVQHGKSFKKSN